ncbi:hypothetical protein EV421DRAFT_1734458 [Armillaria borealis]|uniref:Uncharacterized protein n=1 Tax=Armillaria borealis TaxID=47425 RepID=A0AA39JN31_9AGAR|nr:hypothetical protein EV421DRAFT_1734458 [Armillaria borealis]
MDQLRKFEMNLMKRLLVQDDRRRNGILYSQKRSMMHTLTCSPLFDLRKLPLDRCVGCISGISGYEEQSDMVRVDKGIELDRWKEDRGYSSSFVTRNGCPSGKMLISSVTRAILWSDQGANVLIMQVLDHTVVPPTIRLTRQSSSGVVSLQCSVIMCGCIRDRKMRNGGQVMATVRRPSQFALTWIIRRCRGSGPRRVGRVANAAQEVNAQKGIFGSSLVFGNTISCHCSASSHCHDSDLDIRQSVLSAIGYSRNTRTKLAGQWALEVHRVYGLTDTDYSTSVSVAQDRLALKGLTQLRHQQQQYLPQ